MPTDSHDSAPAPRSVHRGKPRSTTELWRRSQDVLSRVLDLDGESLRDELRQTCGDDAELRQEVEALLALEAEPLERADGLSFQVSTPYGPGDMLGPWRILDELSRGGTSNVYRAEAVDPDEGEPRQVAVKVLRRDLEPIDFERRFQVEGRILGHLRHPSIPKLYEIGMTEDRRPFLVLELVQGLRIDRYCDERNASLEERIRVFIEVCEAVDNAHRSLVIHRDLKPENILVTDEGRAKVLDFGVARLQSPAPSGVGEGESRTVTGLQMLTPAYASPEQLELAPLTTATDIFSLGAVLFELLAGRRLFADPASWRSILDRLGDGDLPVPSETVDLGSEGIEPSSRRGLSPIMLQRSLRGDLDSIVAMALRRRPEQRYASVRDLVRDLKAYLSGRPVRARRFTWLYLAGKLLRRRGKALLVGVVLVSALGAHFVGRALESRRVAIEKEKVETLRDFWSRLFLAAEPGAQGYDVTVVEVLERSANIVEELKEQPEVQATVLSMIGRTYSDLGRPSEAYELLRRSVDLMEVHAPATFELADALNSLGLSAFEMGKLDEALSDLSKAAELFEQLGSAVDGSFLANTLNNLGLVESQVGLHEAAKKHLTRSRMLFAELYGYLHPDAALPVNNLGYSAFVQGNLNEAERWFRVALSIRRQTLKAPHPDIAEVLTNLGGIEYANGEWNEAVVLLREAVSQWQRLLDADHPSLVKSLHNLAGAVWHSGDVESGRKTFEDALAMQRRLFSDPHPVTATLMQAAGDWELGDGIPERSLVLHQASLEMRLSLWGADPHGETAYSYFAVAKALGRLGEWRQAVSKLDEAIRMYTELEDREFLDHSYRLRGDAHARTGDCTAAEQDYHQASELLRKPRPDLDEEVRKSLQACRAASGSASSASVRSD